MSDAAEELASCCNSRTSRREDEKEQAQDKDEKQHQHRRGWKRSDKDKQNELDRGKDQDKARIRGICAHQGALTMKVFCMSSGKFALPIPATAFTMPVN